MGNPTRSPSNTRTHSSGVAHESGRTGYGSAIRLAPATDVPEALRPELQRNGFVEAWLFQTDGRFALRTLALPQRGI